MALQIWIESIARFDLDDLREVFGGSRAVKKLAEIEAKAAVFDRIHEYCRENVRLDIDLQTCDEWIAAAEAAAKGGEDAP